MEREIPDANLVQAFVADRDVSCPACRYNLRGSLKSTCPECGSELSIEIRLAGDQPLRRHRHWLFMQVVLWWIALVGTTGAVGNLIWLSSYSVMLGGIPNSVVTEIRMRLATDSLFGISATVGLLVVYTHRRRACTPVFSRRVFLLVCWLAAAFGVTWGLWVLWSLVLRAW